MSCPGVSTKRTALRPSLNSDCSARIHLESRQLGKDWLLKRHRHKKRWCNPCQLHPLQSEAQAQALLTRLKKMDQKSKLTTTMKKMILAWMAASMKRIHSRQPHLRHHPYTQLVRVRKRKRSQIRSSNLNLLMSDERNFHFLNQELASFDFIIKQ